MPLLLGGVLLDGLLLLEPLVPPGDSAPPVAEPGVNPKNENTCWRQLFCEMSVLASKLGADCNLVLSPLNVKLGVAVVVAAPVAWANLNSIQGTATCFPALVPVELVAALELELLDGVELEVPGVLELLLSLPLVVPEGLVAEPLLVPLELSVKIAKSRRPELASTI